MDQELIHEDMSTGPAESKKAQPFTPEQQELVEHIVKRRLAKAQNVKTSLDDGMTEKSQPSLSPDQLREQLAPLVSDIFQQQLSHHQQQLAEAQRTQHVQKVINELVPRFENASKKFKDFNETVGQIDFERTPELLMLAHSVPNSGEALYELRQNPQKLANLVQLFKVQPVLAQEEMKKLSDSILANEKAKEDELSQPLDRLSAPNAALPGTSGRGRPTGDEDYLRC